MATISGPHTPSDKQRALSRIIKSYRGKVARHAGGPFDTFLALQCSREELAFYIEHHMQDGMSWSNYGDMWWFVNQEPARDYNLKDPEQLCAYYKYSSFRPMLADDVRSLTNHGLPLKPKQP